MHKSVTLVISPFCEGKMMGFFVIGERPSDKLGGEICIASHALVCLSHTIYIHINKIDSILYIYGVRTA